MLPRNSNLSLSLCSIPNRRFQKFFLPNGHSPQQNVANTSFRAHTRLGKGLAAFNDRGEAAPKRDPDRDRQSQTRAKRFKHHKNSSRSSQYSQPPGPATDRDLIHVLELATDEELEALNDILFGLSILSPVIKSVDSSDASPSLPLTKGAQDRRFRVKKLERRFRYLAADALGTLRGRWPSYRESLLNMRSHLGVACSSKLATPDLEAEIFYHLVESHYGNVDERSLGNTTSEGHENSNTSVKASSAASSGGIERSVKTVFESLENGVIGSLRFGASDLLPAISKVGITVAMTRLWGSSALKVAAVKASSAALARSMLSLVGSTLWISTALDLARISIGTDHGRIVRAVFLLAQIRLIRTSGWI